MSLGHLAIRNMGILCGGLMGSRAEGTGGQLHPSSPR